MHSTVGGFNLPRAASSAVPDAAQRPHETGRATVADMAAFLSNPYYIGVDGAFKQKPIFR
jgi:hypothetical protein